MTLKSRHLVSLFFLYDVERFSFGNDSKHPLYVSSSPSWFPIRFPEIDDGRYTYHGHSEHFVTSKLSFQIHVRKLPEQANITENLTMYRVNLPSAHVQEIPENGADIEHLSFLHVPMLGNLLINTWEASWSAQPPPNAHISHIIVKERMALKLFGRVYHLPLPTNVATVRQNGPGFTMHEFEFLGGWWKIIVIGTQTPLAPLVQRACVIGFGSPWTPRWFVKVFLSGFITQFER